jgi:hypothetical protein
MTPSPLVEFCLPDLFTFSDRGWDSEDAFSLVVLSLGPLIFSTSQTDAGIRMTPLVGFRIHP